MLPTHTSSYQGDKLPCPVNSIYIQAYNYYISHGLCTIVSQCILIVSLFISVHCFLCLCHMQVYNSLTVNLYRYSMYFYQLLINERHWNERRQHSFQQQLVDLIGTGLTGLACQLQQISHGSMTTELNEVKDRVKTTPHEPQVNDSVTDMDKLAYVILNTFVNDYTTFFIQFLR